jgi:4'-phosphopantetheinyl transferase
MIFTPVPQYAIPRSDSRHLGLRFGAVHVWKARLSGISHDETHIELSSAEQLRSSQYLNRSARQSYVASHRILRDVLSRYTDQKIEFASEARWRKPSLIGDAGLQFSISRSGDLVLIAVAQGSSVGVDVEFVQSRFDYESVAGSVLTEDERLQLAALDRSERRLAFFRCWTRKEAVLKCTGQGLGEDPRLVEVGVGLEPAAFTGFRVFSFVPEPGYIASLASEAGEIDVSYREWAAERGVEQRTEASQTT